MAPRKKQHSSEAAKQAVWAKRQQQAGRRRVCVWLSTAAADALKAQAKEAGQTQAEVIERKLLRE
jgi:hypothetical protein